MIPGLMEPQNQLSGMCVALEAGDRSQAGGMQAHSFRG